MKDFERNRFLWRKPECQPQKISKEVLNIKNLGSVDIVASTMFFLILVLTIFFGFRVTQYMVTAAGVEDALAASNLASAIIDLEEYGKNHRIYIGDTDRAFQIYREALCCNLKLDEYMNTTNTDFLAGQVEIKRYVIYNVQDKEVDILIFDGNGVLLSQTSGNRGEIFTPDDVCVENTTIYSRIGFWVEGLSGQKMYAEKEKSIDIVRCDSE